MDQSPGLAKRALLKLLWPTCFVNTFSRRLRPFLKLYRACTRRGPSPKRRSRGKLLSWNSSYTQQIDQILKDRLHYQGETRCRFLRGVHEPLPSMRVWKLCHRNFFLNDVQICTNSAKILHPSLQKICHFKSAVHKHQTKEQYLLIIFLPNPRPPPTDEHHRSDS